MESFVEVFGMVSNLCKNEISETAHNLWIACIEPIGFDGTTVSLYVRSSFQKKIIEEKYLSLLRRSFESVLGFEVQVNILSEETAPDAKSAAATLRLGEGENLPQLTSDQVEKTTQGGEYEYTFDTFIVGQSNKFAHAAAMAVAANPSGTYNPLFIYGGSGLGKTHLLNAICHEIAEDRPNMNLVYVKGEEFTNELINAIKTETTPAFHEKYRKSDVLLVDDIQFIGGKESTQEEFFHTFNSLYQDGKQIVLTSDRPPKEMEKLEESVYHGRVYVSKAFPNAVVKINGAALKLRDELSYCYFYLAKDGIHWSPR